MLSAFVISRRVLLLFATLRQQAVGNHRVPSLQTDVPPFAVHSMAPRAESMWEETSMSFLGRYITKAKGPRLKYTRMITTLRDQQFVRKRARAQAHTRHARVVEVQQVEKKGKENALKRHAPSWPSDPRTVNHCVPCTLALQRCEKTGSFCAS